MSRGNHAYSVPFDSTYTGLPTGSSNTSYPPPAERPLLHDEENNFLESFFNDPNNIDQTNLPNDYQADASVMYNNPDWINSNSGEYPSQTTSNPSTIGRTSQVEWLQQQDPGLDQASADVYAAAGILHNNSNPHTDTSAILTRQHNDNYNNNAFAIPTTGTGSTADAMNGYSYPPLNPTSGSPYNFDANNAPVRDVFELNPRYNQSESATPYLTSIQNRVAGGPGSSQTRPAGPLAFGSDDNFRANYIAPPGETPDKTLDEAIIHNFADNSKAHRQRKPPTASMKKRARAGQDENGNGEGIAELEPSFEEEDSVGTKRRKDDGENEDDYENGTSQPKKGKRRATSANIGGGDIKDETDSPGRKVKSSTSGGSKSNRENLTEEQKRNNHIQSEQKRRNLIKQGFDDLNRMVPELRSGSLSKSNMLVESAKFMKMLRDSNDELRNHLQGLEKG